VTVPVGSTVLQQDVCGDLGMITVGIAHIQPVVALVAGILILVLPRLLNIIVAIYLILVGLAGLGVLR
jgi:hypothetical protein